jgi:drug/metabolite transporter superfamily protein YnfA
MRSWDSHYLALTEMHDTEQAPQKGGLLYARYGGGAYVYVAYALDRQMPEGVPGSFRIISNLISLPKNPTFQGAAGEGR